MRRTDKHHLKYLEMTTYCSGLRLVPIIIIFPLFFIACREVGHPPAAPTADSSAQAAMGSRGRLIEALREVRRLIASKDSQQIALMFRFPIADSYIPLSGDSVFESEKARNSDQITRALFLSGYGQIKQELQFDVRNFCWNGNTSLMGSGCS